MPFPDEEQRVTIVEYDPRWPGEFDHLAARLTTALRGTAFAIDHFGSTAVSDLSEGRHTSLPISASPRTSCIRRPPIPDG
jgi:GrpB protein